MRRFSDEVHVRCGVLAGSPGAPVQFVWRSRLYLVHAVLAHWRERSAWWEQPAVAAVHGDGALEDVPGDVPGDVLEAVLDGAPGGGRSPGRASAAGGRRVLALGHLEREVFRVEAAVGRTRSGVYDLAHPVAAGTAAAGHGAARAVVSEAPGNQEADAWRLLRVSD